MKPGFSPGISRASWGIKRQQLEVGGTLGPGGSDVLCGHSAGWGAPPVLSSFSLPRFLQLVGLNAPSLVPNCHPHGLLPSCPPGTSSWWPSLLLLPLLWSVAILPRRPDAQYQGGCGWTLLLTSPDGYNETRKSELMWGC